MKQNAPEKAPNDPRFAAQEAKTKRLAALVQTMADECHERDRQVGVLTLQLSEAVAGNRRLCNAILWLKQRLAHTESEAHTSSRVVALFHGLLRPSTKSICSHYFCQRFLAQVMVTLKAESPDHSISGDPSDLPVFQSVRKNYSLFYTI
jgi:hypothetical protein